MLRILLIISILCVSLNAYAIGNEFNDNFSKAKHILETQVYFDNKTTLYCEAKFNLKNIILPDGFHTEKFENRSHKLEWEHVVPAENFGRNFKEWTRGDPLCNNIKGRKCAEKANIQYRYMQADLYNLYPAIGAVNASRSNYNFQMLDKNMSSSFGSCQMKIYNNKVEPPEYTRGIIARTYKYMHHTYPMYKMSNQQLKLMDAWDKMYPVTEWECIRNKRIENIQKNENIFVKSKCQF